MPVSCQNPLGLEGFAFVEFTAPDPDSQGRQLERLGFIETHRHPGQSVSLYRQGDIHFILNAEPFSHASDFATRHGPSACGMGFRVSDAARAHRLALQHGATPVEGVYTPFGDDLLALEGVGGTLIYLLDDSQFSDDVLSGWVPLTQPPVRQVHGAGLTRIDHLTHDLPAGQMQVWADFYTRVFGFESQRYFEVDDRLMGVDSQTLIAPDGHIRIPLNESRNAFNATEAFLSAYGGEGIQHIALETRDIYATVEGLRARGVAFQAVPDPYYEMLDRRVPHHNEDVARMKTDGILIDGNARRDGILLQVFTENTFGPVFFEIVQRKGGHGGFGGGNAQALMEAAGLDQMRKGLLRV
ncbi:4-hydroxyphenylpyruvate dioxygenase [Asticcacaulis sp. YBE204]|uniref:4-hydroxyphenylpyruvate dioxygenase n=1 Tax=Asticcacaulis sp. YBE204 TaxID=1282363 RepID=UPI0004270905|nr:4-hydroxyphenylpyruvate dioxygenase [Asticcacaulis sp. YBE204]